MNFRRPIYLAKWRLIRPQAFAAARRLAANERKSPDELAAIQEAARQGIVRHAFENCPFYRELYSAAGFEPGDAGKDGWFERLPILTKAHIRERYADMLDPALRKFAKTSTTGGSTGVPLKTAYDGRLPIEVYAWRQLEWFGAHPWDHMAYVWRATRKTSLAKFRNACLWWPTRHLTLDASLICETDIRRFLDEYAKLKPAVLYGYVGAVTQLAQHVVEHGLQTAVANPNLELVWVTSAPLSAVQRRLIGAAFGARVCDQYGSCEIRGIAQQCPECRGLHVNIERVHLEFVGESAHPVATGEYGRTLLTNLEDRVFPLIRYENGDRGRWLGEACPCGRTLPCIDSVKGRESEGFRLPDGRTVNGEFLTTIFDETPDIVRGFRVVQHRDLSMTVEYVPAGDEAPVRAVLDRFARTLGEAARLEGRRVESIPHDRGKLRFVVREG